MLCGLTRCPIIESFRARVKTTLIATPGLVKGATPPSTVVGERGYPKVPVLISVPPGVVGERAREYEDPVGWWGRKSLNEIVRLRSSMISGVVRVHVENPWLLYEKEYGLACISEKPVDTVLSLDKVLSRSLSFDYILKPVGVASRARDVIIESNPRVPSVIEKLIWDDARAEDAVWEAYRGGASIYLIERAFSLGFMGRVRSRRLVPTRWAITAVDDILARRLVRVVNDCKDINMYIVFTGEYLHNKFIIVLEPGAYRGYWLEAWYPGSAWGLPSEPVIHVVREDEWCRQKPMDGGFSAARTPVLEYLYKIGRRARVFIFREVYPQYIVPVGNWHIRETVKRALSKPALETSDSREIISFLKNELKSTRVFSEAVKLFWESKRQARLDECVWR